MTSSLQQFPDIPPKNGEETDWIYIMRREMQEILPHLYLGPYAAAGKSKLQTLLDLNITHIVCIRQQIEANFIRPNFPNNFKYLVLDIADLQTENIIQHICQFRTFINECLQCGGKVLVHGNAGISRSAALVIAYVMEAYRLSYKTASMYVQQKRFCINPNEGFTQQLMEYEYLYRARMVDGGHMSVDTANLKRKCHFDADDCLHTDPSNMT